MLASLDKGVKESRVGWMHVEFFLNMDAESR